MPLKTKPLSKAELAAYEETRDLAEELLQSVREMQAGKVHVRPHTSRLGARPQATERRRPYFACNRQHQSQSRTGCRIKVVAAEHKVPAIFCFRFKHAIRAARFESGIFQ